LQHAKGFHAGFLPGSIWVGGLPEGEYCFELIYLLPAGTLADAFVRGQINLMLFICICFTRHTNAGGGVPFQSKSRNIFRKPGLQL
jgi:hypothetical protein